LLAAVFGDVTGEGMPGAFVHVLCKWVCFTEIAFKCSMLRAARVMFEDADSDVLGGQ